jgi:hypothetical protein
LFLTKEIFFISFWLSRVWRFHDTHESYGYLATTTLPVASRNPRETQDADDSMMSCLKSKVHQHILMDTLSGADKVSGDLWQLVTAIHDKGDGLRCCE